VALPWATEWAQYNALANRIHHFNSHSSGPVLHRPVELA